MSYSKQVLAPPLVVPCHGQSEPFRGYHCFSIRLSNTAKDTAVLTSLHGTACMELLCHGLIGVFPYDDVAVIPVA